MKTKQLSEAIGWLAWSYVFLYVDFTLLVVNILPDWAAYLLILKALPVLAEWVPSAILLRPLGRILCTWCAAEWILESLGRPVDVYLLTVLISVISLYFFFQLLTNLAEILRILNFSEEKKILRLRTVQAVMFTLTALPFPWERYMWLTTGIVIIYLLIALWVCVILFG